MGDTGIPFLTAVLQAGATLVVGFLNWAIQTGVKIVIGIVEVALKPILDAIAAVAGVLAVASEIASLVRPWTVKVLSGSDSFHKGVSSVVTEEVQAVVHLGGPTEWPVQVTSCASLADVTLPSLSPEGLTFRSAGARSSSWFRPSRRRCSPG